MKKEEGSAKQKIEKGEIDKQDEKRSRGERSVGELEKRRVGREEANEIEEKEWRKLLIKTIINIMIIITIINNI